MNDLDWQHRWATYEGEIRVVLDDTSVQYGTATGDHHTEADNPLMNVIIDGESAWVHPKFVWPKELCLRYAWRDTKGLHPEPDVNLSVQKSHSKSRRKS